jgi:hypothetical protein
VLWAVSRLPAGAKRRRLRPRPYGVTVSVVIPTMAPLVAEMLVVPAAKPLANPFVAVAFETVAVSMADDAQVTMAVRSCIDASV